MKASELERLRRIEASHFWFQARRRELGPWLAAADREAPPGPLLDLGVGTGGNLDLLVSRASARRVIGIDRSDVALAHCRSAAPHLTFSRATAEALPLADATLAIATALDLFEHLPDDLAAATELARCTIPGGNLIATVPASMVPFSDHDRALGHQRRYRKGALEDLLERAGFEVLERRGFNSLLLPLIAGWRTLRRLGPRAAPPHSDLRPIPPLLNRTLGTIMRLESSLPRRIQRFGGVSWWVRARRRT